jgi:hypothetical protein
LKNPRTIATTEFFDATELADFINDNNDSGSAIIDVTDNEGRTFSRATLVETLTDGTLVYKIILAE